MVRGLTKALGHERPEIGCPSIRNVGERPEEEIEVCLHVERCLFDLDINTNHMEVHDEKFGSTTYLIPFDLPLLDHVIIIPLSRHDDDLFFPRECLGSVRIVGNDIPHCDTPKRACSTVC